MKFIKLRPDELWNAMADTNDNIAEVLKHKHFLASEDAIPQDEAAKAALLKSDARLLKRLSKEFGELSDALEVKIAQHLKKDRNRSRPKSGRKHR